MRTGLSLWLLLSLPLLGQEARISGKVTALDKRLVAGSVVILTQPDSGWMRQVLTNRHGQFSIDRLLPGHYRVEAVKPGFKDTDRFIDVGAGQSVSVDLRLAAEAPSIPALTLSSDFP